MMTIMMIMIIIIIIIMIMKAPTPAVMADKKQTCHAARRAAFSATVSDETISETTGAFSG